MENNKTIFSLTKLSKEEFDSFGPSNLGLGDLTLDSVPTDAIAAVFDLAGFTNFCKQIEPHLVVPTFLNRFLNWLFNDIKSEMFEKETKGSVSLWCPLPFYTKFMGDGLLVLWSASNLTDRTRRNIISSCYNICIHYKRDFYPLMRRIVSDPPAILRCGIARGTVFSVGNGGDFVGSCINMAARLQKLSGTTFAFNRRGINMEDSDGDVAKQFINNYIITEVDIRGIGQHELVAIRKLEYEGLSKENKAFFKLVSD
jgi:class 3 adenylate cyclase